MRKNFMTIAFTVGLALSASSCSQRERDQAERQADRAADKVESAANKAADKVESAADKAGAEMSEAATTAAVKSKLAADVKLSTLTRINVDTNGHTVTLTGTVPTAVDKTSAEVVAKSVDGVVAVVNNLVVKP